MVKIKCYKCGEVFGVSEWTNTFLRRSQHYFYCPFGHEQYFPQNEQIEDPKDNVVQFEIVDGDKK